MHQLNSIFGLAIIIIAGYLGAKLLRKIYFPAVTAYLIAGIFIGPQLLNLIPPKIIGFSDTISNFVLGVIAFSLGANFTLRDIKAAGKPVFWISILEAGFAWLIVTLTMIIYFVLKHMPIHPALVLGAASAATAPAATVMVIREYRAKGIVTETLLRVVAIDDAWCLIFSALAITVASALHSGMFNFSIIVKAVLKLILSLLVGGFLGFGLHFISRFVKTQEELLLVTSSFIFLTVGLSMSVHLSSLLANMALGIVIANISKNGSLFFEVLKNIDSMLFLIFFVVVGANLEISLIPEVGFIGFFYIIFRAIGKFVGVKLGALKSRAEEKVGNYLAWGLIPQAGVALGVALSAKALYPQYGEMIFTTITATTVIYELIGPMCAKYGLQKAGEI